MTPQSPGIVGNATRLDKQGPNTLPPKDVSDKTRYRPIAHQLAELGKEACPNCHYSLPMHLNIQSGCQYHPTQTNYRETSSASWDTSKGGVRLHGPVIQLKQLIKPLTHLNLFLGF